MVCFKTPSKWENRIVDGQQRLTTVSIFARALANRCTDNDLSHDIIGTLLVNSGYGLTDDQKIKLHLNKRDDEIWRCMVTSDHESIVRSIGDDEKKSRSLLYKNYLYFYNVLEKYDNNDIVTIFDALSSLTINMVDIANGEDEQAIFESLNSTGLDLTDVDRIRNRVLANLPAKTQEKFYDNYWLKIEDNIGNDNMIEFFCDYFVMRSKSNKRFNISIIKKNLYRFFKIFYETEVDAYKKDNKTVIQFTEDLLRGLSSNAKLYKKLIPDQGNNDLGTMKGCEETTYCMVTVLRSVQARALALYFLNLLSKKKISNAAFEKCYNIMLNYNIRARICGTSAIGYQLAGNVILRWENIVSDDNDYLASDDTIPDDIVTNSLYIAMITSGGTYTFAEDGEFRNSLLHSPIYSSSASIVKMLLFMIEKRGPARKGLPRYDSDSLSIDHIFPQSPDPETLHEFSSSDPDALKHVIGNLALTTRNSEMSNKKFSEKKKNYALDNFYYTKKLSELGSWTEKDVMKRGNELIDAILAIWNLPKEYQGANADKYKAKTRRIASSFRQLELPIGTQIKSIYDSSAEITVADTKNMLEYNGKKYSCTKLAMLLSPSNTKTLNGYDCFTYNGERLSARRLRLERETLHKIKNSDNETVTNNESSNVSDSELDEMLGVSTDCDGQEDDSISTQEASEPTSKKISTKLHEAGLNNGCKINAPDFPSAVMSLSFSNNGSPIVILGNKKFNLDEFATRLYNRAGHNGAINGLDYFTCEGRTLTDILRAKHDGSEKKDDGKSSRDEHKSSDVFDYTQILRRYSG